MHDTFEAYCKSKKINAELFETENAQFAYLKNYFEQTSEASFTAQKLFLINELRRSYLLKETEVVLEETTIARPKMGMSKMGVPKIKAKVETETSNESETQSESLEQKVEKPKVVSKPMMRPKIPSKKVEVKEGSDTVEKPKPIAKPVMKPKIPKPEIKTGEDTAKPKVMAKPIMRPKIPKKED